MSERAEETDADSVDHVEERKDDVARVIGSGGAVLTRLQEADFELMQPASPSLTLSILLRGRSRPWRDLGEGLKIPKGAEAFRHHGAVLVTPHDTDVVWRVEGRHDCLVLSFAMSTAAPLLEELLPEGAASLYRLTDRMVRDPIFHVVARDLWHSASDRIGRFQADHSGALLLARLARHASPVEETAARAAKERLSPTNLRRAQDFLRSCVASDPSLEEVAAVAGLSRYHFLRGFKAATGRTPFQWLRDLRVEQACSLLATTNVPIAHIALEVGFSSQSHFTEVFRRSTGRTPARWRGDLRA